VGLPINGLGVVVRDARNEDRSVMNRDLVVEGVVQLIQIAFTKLSCDGVGEHSISPGLELVFQILRLLRIR
jgi:hypothetical protein